MDRGGAVYMGQALPPGACQAGRWRKLTLDGDIRWWWAVPITPCPLTPREYKTRHQQRILSMVETRKVCITYLYLSYEFWSQRHSGTAAQRHSQAADLTVSCCTHTG